MIIRGLKALFVLSLMAAPCAAFAADPSSLVGRVSYIDGTVSFHAADQTQWSFATLNYPVSSGLSFWTEPGGRTELEIGASQLRLDSSTAVDVLQLNPTTTQIQLDQGSINYYVTQIEPGQTIEFETPHGAVAITKPGTYHIDAGDANTPTVVAALEGEARLIGVQSYLDVGAGEQATAIGTPLSYTMAPATPTDFDNWALARDKREQTVEAVKYVSPQTTGYQDLDQYGQWQPSPQYGTVWYPQNVASDWAPYHDGHWAYVEPWGYTWVDNAPWGFAPFHYGRWAQIDNRWGWVPGTIQPRPVYAPALVAFTGGGIGVGPGGGVRVGVGLDIGGIGVSIGWIPLAPNEPYYPPYGGSRGYWQNMNQGAVNRTVINNYNPNFTHVTVNNYANHGAATFVPTAAFTGARPVAAAAVRPNPATYQNAAVNNNLSTLKPSPYARAATAAPVGRNGAAPAATAPAAAPGPSEAVQHNEAAQIQHEAPSSVSTQGKTEGQAQPQGVQAQGTRPQGVQAQGTRPQGVQAPEAARPEAQANAMHPAAQAGAAPGPAIRPTAENHEAQTPQTPETRAAEARAPEAQPAAEEHDALHPHAGAEPGTAPGPAITKAAAQTMQPVRQKLVAKSEAAQARTQPKAEAVTERAQAAPQATAAAKPAAQAVRAQAAAYHPAQVERPAQAAPLKATPAGWNRGEAAPAAKPAAAPAAKPAPDKDAKDKDKKDEQAH